MKILVDMNLSPSWVQVLERNGYSAIHWSTVGDEGAPDSVILDWAYENGYIVFTHDLDFGAISPRHARRRQAWSRFAPRT